MAPVHRQFLLAGQQLRILDHHSSAHALVQRVAALAATEAAEARAAARAAGDDWAGVPTAVTGLRAQTAGCRLVLLKTKVQGGGQRCNLGLRAMLQDGAGAALGLAGVCLLAGLS